MNASHTDQLLRTLDPADATIDPALAARVDAELERILTTNATTSPSSPANLGRGAPVGRGGLRPRRLALLAGAAMVITGGALALPGLGGDAPAYASWTATPNTPTAADTAVVVATCRAQIGKGKPLGGERSDGATMAALAERRGDYVMVVLTNPAQNLAGYCLYEHESGSPDVEGDPLFGGVSEGGAAPPSPRAIVEDGISESGDGTSSMSTVLGRVGPDVASVTLRSQGHVVNATVADGRYAAWWPGRAFPERQQDPTGGGPATTITYDLTLTDGTVLRDVQPAQPTG